MEGTLFPNRPAFPNQPSKPSQSSKRLKFNPTTLPLSPQPPSTPSFPLDPLLKHLLYLSSPPPVTTHKSKFVNPAQISNTHFKKSDNSLKYQELESAHFGKSGSVSTPVLEKTEVEALQLIDDELLDFLPKRSKFILYEIVEQPLSSLNSYFESIKFELIDVDFVSVLKGLDITGNWEKAVCLFEWNLLNFGIKNDKLDDRSMGSFFK